MTDHAEQMNRISHRQSYFRPRSGISSSGSCLIDKNKQNGWGRSWIQIYMKTFFIFFHTLGIASRSDVRNKLNMMILMLVQYVIFSLSHFRWLNWIHATCGVSTSGVERDTTAPSECLLLTGWLYLTIMFSAHLTFFPAFVQNHSRHLVHSDLQQMDIAACLR